MHGFRRVSKAKTVVLAMCLVTVWFARGFCSFAGASEARMKGPHVGPAQPSSTQELPTSSVKIAFLESIKFYQKWISPIGGDRCGFRPSCSRYGYAAIRSQGPIVGLMMTGDRLTRCNIWKRPGPDYIRFPDGKLYDPPSNNLLLEE